MASSMTKSDFVSAMSDKTGMSRKEVGAFLDAMNGLVVDQLKSNGQVTIPGMLKLKMSERAATSERPGINPFTKAPITIKAKPARRVVRAAPVKALKDSI